jgi:hypothetical protein
MAAIRQEGGKTYLEGIRRVSWDSGEMCEFASALTAAMESLGEDIDYHHVMGTSGAAFRFTINPGEWDFGNYGIRNIAADPYEPMRRAMEAVGYGYTLCDKGSWRDDLAKITGSIDRGVPVLAYPVVGPSDCCIITGYDQSGEVLLGWSTFQNIPDDHNIPHDTTGYFRKPGWHDNLDGYILLGAKKERPPERVTYLGALQWAVQLMRTPQVGKNCTGLAGLSMWADEMTQERYFPPEDEQVLGLRYVSTSINITMLRDHCSAEPFLRQMARSVREFLPEVELAADCYARVRRLLGEMSSLISDDFSDRAMKAIRDSATRRAFADLILQIRDTEEQASSHMQHLLERCGGC